MASSILCENILTTATVSSEDTISGFPMEYGVSATTALQAGFATGASREQVFSLNGFKTYDCIGLVKHSLFSNSAQVKIYSGSSPTGPWTLVHTVIMTSDNALLQDFTETSSSYLMLEVNFPAADTYVGNISIGKRVDISEGQYVGFTQPENANRYNVTANITRGGEVSGLLRTPTAIKTRIEAKHLRKAWVDANWKNISDCITRYPFYFRWEDGADSVYCWAKKISPPKWDSISRQSFSLDCEGLV